MAETYTYGAQTSLSTVCSVALAGDRLGSVAATFLKDITWDVAGGTPPTVTGFMNGTGTAAATDALLAHATDPLGTMGDAAYSEGFTVAGSKLKLLIIENLDATNTLTISRGAANGLAIFGAASAAMPIPHGGVFVWYDPTGAVTGALTTGSNDKLTFAVSGGSPTYQLLAVYGS